MDANFFVKDDALFSSGGVLVNEENKKVLIIRRDDSKEYLLPKGRIDGLESPKETAQREIFEETGYENEIKDLIRVQIRPDKKNELKHKIVFWFYAKLTNLSKKEGTQMSDENFIQEWISFDTAIEKLRWEDDKKLIKIIKERFAV